MLRRLLPCLLLLSPIALCLGLDFRVEPDANNITASRIFGLWEGDPVGAERLGTKVPKETLELVEDDSFLAQLPAQYEKFLGEKRIYAAGRATWRTDGRVSHSAPFLLVEHAGNPCLVSFRDRDGVALGDAESAYLFVAPGQTREQDLFLLGGDFNNEPFRALRRVKSEQ